MLRTYVGLQRRRLRIEECVWLRLMLRLGDGPVERQQAGLTLESHVSSHMWCTWASRQNHKGVIG